MTPRPLCGCLSMLPWTDSQLSCSLQGDFWLGQLQSHPSGDGGGVQAGGQPLPVPWCRDREGSAFRIRTCRDLAANANRELFTTTVSFKPVNNCLVVCVCMCESSRDSPKSCPCRSLCRRSTRRSKSSSTPASSSPSLSTAGWPRGNNAFALQPRPACEAHAYVQRVCHVPHSPSSTEIDDMLRKSTNLLLTRTLSSCLQNLIKKPHIGLTEVGGATWSRTAPAASAGPRFLKCLKLHPPFRSWCRSSLTPPTWSRPVGIWRSSSQTSPTFPLRRCTPPDSMAFPHSR